MIGKRYSADFKAKVAPEAIRGELTISQPVAKHGVHQTAINAWKKRRRTAWRACSPAMRVGVDQPVPPLRSGDGSSEVIERLWRSIKYERACLNAFETGGEARAGIERWIDHYNTDRTHSAFGGRTPTEVHQGASRPEPMWRRETDVNQA